MKISVIIPVYNAAKCLRACLKSVSESKYPDFEVIAVEDKSTDDSTKILKEYLCTVISLPRNQGTANARNVGARQANGEILVFIDSDVVIHPDTLAIIAKEMSAHPQAVAVTGLLALTKTHNNFFTEYKNLYMNFILKKCAGPVDFLYGSLMAIRKRDFLPFDTSYPVTDDTELGQRFKSLGKTIILSPSLEVIHLKEYSFCCLGRNDFSVPFWWTKTFLKYHGLKDVLLKKRFSHTRGNQILSIILVYLILLSAMIVQMPNHLLVLLLLLAGYAWANLDFFRFISREKGKIFLAQSVCLTFFDHMIMGLGILSGFIYFSLQNLLNKRRNA